MPILKQDFYSLAEVSEQDSMMMHAVMMTQTPPLFYWEPASLEIMKKVTGWREGRYPLFRHPGCRSGMYTFFVHPRQHLSFNPN